MTAATTSRTTSAFQTTTMPCIEHTNRHVPLRKRSLSSLSSSSWHHPQQERPSSFVLFSSSSSSVEQQQAILTQVPLSSDDDSKKNNDKFAASFSAPQLEPNRTVNMRTQAVLQAMEQVISSLDAPKKEEEYQRGLVTIGFCTLVFASMSPVMHAALNSGNTLSCPVVLLNAAVSIVAYLSLQVAGPYLEALIPPPSTLMVQKMTQKTKSQIPQLQKLLQQQESAADATGLSSLLSALTTWWNSISIVNKAGMELGFWKFLGTVANLYGLSMTTADHGAFLIQLTTLIVPTVQGIMGVPIPQRIQFAVALALAGVALFTQDAGGSGVVVDATSAMATETRLWGNALCVVAAAFYATYDLRLFTWGKQVRARQLITTKIAAQALLSLGLLLVVGMPDTANFVQNMIHNDIIFTSYTTAGDSRFILIWQLSGIVLWSGVMVNAIVPFLQVGGQQAIGPTRAQTLYASQPLWAAILSFVFLGETIGVYGLVGGGFFLTALFLAATAEAPDPDCGKDTCEV